MSTAVITGYRYLTQDPRICGDQPVIKETRTAIKTIAGYYKMGFSVEEILEGLPHLTPAQVYEALSYYHDHQSEIEHEIAESRVEDLVERYDLHVTADGQLIPKERCESCRHIHPLPFTSLAESLALFPSRRHSEQGDRTAFDHMLSK